LIGPFDAYFAKVETARQSNPPPDEMLMQPPQPTPMNADEPSSRVSRLRRKLNDTWSILRKPIDWDLKDQVSAAEKPMKQPFVRDEVPPNLAGPKLGAILEHLREVVNMEFDREANLNGRAAAVAGVAGLIVTASGAVGKSIFEEDVERYAKLAAVVLFLVGLVAVAAAMFMVVLMVLWPKQAPTRRIFVTDTLMGLWIQKGRSAIADAELDRLNLLVIDRLLRMVAHWSVRNRQKARWLRRAWMSLALGILLIGGAGIVVVSTVLGYSLHEIFAIVAAALVLVWLVLKLDPIRAARKPDELNTEEMERQMELNEIAATLMVAAPANGPPPANGGAPRGRVAADTTRRPPRIRWFLVGAIGVGAFFAGRKTPALWR
jgi:hypothetical protein